MSDPWRDLNRLWAKSVTEKDQELGYFRDWYMEASEKERASTRRWLEQMVDLTKQALGLFPYMDVRLKMSEEHHDDEGGVVYSASADLRPEMMLRAINAWDSDEEFTPKNPFV